MPPNQHDMGQHVLRRLTLALEVQLDEVSEQPDADLKFFMDSIPQYRTWVHHPRILDKFISQFDEPPPNAVVWSPSTDAAARALSGLSLAIGSTEEERHLLRERILSRWTHVWPWMNFLYCNLSLFGDLPLDPSFWRHSLLPVFLLLVGESLCAWVVSTEGVLRLACMMWIRLAETPEDVHAYASVLAMSDTLLTLIKSPLVDIKELHAALDFNKRRAVEDLFKPIQISIRGGSAWARCLYLTLEIHRNICMRTPAFYGSLPTNTVVSGICDALSAAIATVGPASGVGTMRPEHTQTIIAVSCALFIGYTSQAAESYSWAIYALRCNILSLLFDCRLRVQDGATCSTIDAILDELKLCSVYRPVLRHLKQSGLVDLPLEKLQDEKARTAWTSILNAISFMCYNQAEFDKLGEYSPSCTYHNCGAQDKPMAKVRRCLGCKIAWYCSVDCQKLDWSKHRNVCGSNRPSRNPLEHPRTQMFFRYLVGLQTIYKETSIADDLHRFRLNDPTPQRLILLADYSLDVPAKFSIHPFERLGQSISPEGDWKPTLLPCIRVRYGARNRELILRSHLHGEMFGWFQRPESDD